MAKAKMVDLIVKAFEEIGGEVHLKDIHDHILSTPEGKARFTSAKSRGDDLVDIKAQIRCVVQRDPRFAKTSKRGYWKLTGATVSAKKRGRKPQNQTDARVMDVLAPAPGDITVPKEEEPATEIPKKED
jgi:hypothetical protein